jgi:hypothetical protein
VKTETEYQYQTFNHDEGLRPRVFTERMVDIDKSEVPAINVYLFQGDFENQDQTQTEGTYQYYIDIYTQAKDEKGMNTDPEKRGDYKAVKQLHRLMAMVQKILEAPAYRTLGFEAPFLGRRWVSKIGVPPQNTSGNSTNEVHGLLIFNVVVPETFEEQVPVTMEGIDTRVTLYETEQGYEWKYPQP